MEELTQARCPTTLSDMALLRVKNRDFQRATGGWLQKARQGNTVLIISPEGPPLTLKAGPPKPEKGSIGIDTSPGSGISRRLRPPVDELRRVENR